MITGLKRIQNGIFKCRNRLSIPIFILWQNSPAVIVGKHQNALAEINVAFVMANNIPVVRRLTGGGTVFHDKGNINFTFIKNADDEGKMIDFRKYAGPILEGLQSLGLNAQFSARNDIFLNDKKISGNAEHIYAKKKRVLHHGTLLFNSNLALLNEAIKANPDRYIDKAVNSVRSVVTNIVDYLNPAITVESFYTDFSSITNSPISPAYAYQTRILLSLTVFNHLFHYLKYNYLVYL